VASTAALFSNVMNNLPGGFASGSAVSQMDSSGLVTHAVVIGVDL
jgi:Na+/H+ antiporter NhaD/arsenite permease-like protein